MAHFAFTAPLTPLLAISARKISITFHSFRRVAVARRAAQVAIFFSIATATTAALAQGGPIRDQAALTLLQNSVSAMGGMATWASIQDWTIAGQASTSGSSQQAAFSWIGAGAEFRFEADTSQMKILFLSGHGSPARIINGNVSPINYFIARANPPLYLPGVRLAQELSNQQLTIQYVGTATVHGVPAVQVHVCDNSDAIGSLVTPHDWFFDATLYLPLQVQLRIPPNENAAHYINGAFDFWQFQTISGLLVPTQISLSEDSLPTRAYVVSSAAFNTGVPQSAFDAPGGGGQ